MKKAITPMLLLGLLLGLSCVSAYAQRVEECSYLPQSTNKQYSKKKIIVDDLGYFVIMWDDCGLCGGATYNHFIGRYDRAHNELWNKKIDYYGYEASEFSKGAGNTAYVVLGSTVYKYNSSGTRLFTLSTNYTSPTVKEDASGNLMVGGDSWQGDKYYLSVSSYTSTGTFRWEANIIPATPTNVMYGIKMKVLTNGTVLISGDGNTQTVYGMVRADGTIAFNRKIDKIDTYISTGAIDVATDGYYFLSVQWKSGSNSDLYLYKTDLNGVVIRSSKVNTLYTYNEPYAMTIVDNVNPIISYLTSNISDFSQNRGTVSKFSSTGTVTWSYNRTNEFWSPHGIQTDNVGNIYVNGLTSVVKLSASGVKTDEYTGEVLDYSITARGDVYLLNENGCILATIKNCAPLVITTNIVNKSVCLGATTDLQFAATGQDVWFQWYKGTEPLFDDAKFAGSKTSKLTVTNMNYTDVGAYKCVATDLCNKTVTSAISNLTLAAPLAITTHPVSKLVCATTTTTLTVVATGGTNIRYQWTKNGVNMTDIGNISGSKTATLTLSAVSSTDAATYVCSVVNDCNITVVSSGASVAIGSNIQITKQPVAQSATSGSEVIFSIEASGTGTLYQWKLNNVNLINGTRITGATSSVLSIKGITCADAGTITCTMTANCGTPVNSSAVALTVTSPVIISQNPSVQKICIGETTTMTVQATGSNLTYSWMRGTTVLADGGHYAGTKTSVLTISTAATADAGTYSCMVSGGCGSTQPSLSATLELITAPSFVSQTVNGTFCSGETIKLSVGLSTGTYTYQWMKEGVALINTSTTTGVTASNLFIINSKSSDAGGYSCRVTGCGGQTTTSSIIAVAVTERTAIITQPITKSFCEGGDVSLSISANSTTATYQWMKSGVTLTDDDHITGSTTNQLVIHAAEIALHQGYYTCHVRGDCGIPVTSNVVQVVGNANPDLFLSGALSESDCLQLTTLEIEEIVGDSEELSGTFKLFKQNSTTPLAGLKSISLPGVYEIIKTTDSNCSDKITFTISCVVTGIEDETPEVVLNPNPSNGTVHLRGGSSFVRYQIINAIGMMISDGDIVGAEQQIDLNNVSAGIYVFVLHGRNGERKSQKLILNK